MQFWGQSQKSQKDLCLFPSKSVNIRVIQVHVPTSNAEEAEAEWFYEDLQDLLELTLKKVSSFRCLLHHRGLECKSKKSRDNWSNRQICPWCTGWSRAKANRVSRPAQQAGFLKVRYCERMRNETRTQWKARIRGPRPLQGEGADTESRPAL